MDASKWSFEVNCWGGGNDEQQCYTNSQNNLKVSNGQLEIIARKGDAVGTTLPDEHPDYDPSQTRTLPYSSARIRSKGKGDWQYGRVEVRAKLPAGQGVWPAIWMLPTDWSYGGWAASGEIDIMEAVNLGTPSDRSGAERGETQRRVFGSLHFGGEWPDNTHLTNAYVFESAVTPVDAFNVYAIEWEQDEIRWYVNDTHYATIGADQWYSGGKTPQSLAATAPFDQPFHLILNLAIGGKWPEEKNQTGVDATGFPKTMWVDYVRVYQ
nr:glycoside hydrolase family 16 protein [Saliniradius amylolyticus]